MTAALRRGARRRSARGFRPRSPVLLALLLVLAVVSVGVFGFAALRARSAAAAGAHDASQYTPPPLATPNVVTNQGGVGGGPKVTVIGDDLSTGPGGRSNALWTTLLQRDLGVNVTTLAAVGSGYTASPQYGASRTFMDAASQTVSGSVDVVFFGGANDAGKPTLSIIKAASQAFSDAKSASGKGQIFVVGPPWPSRTPPSSVLAVRDALRSAALIAGARWVDPIGQGWLSGKSDLLSSDGVTLTDRGQQVVANRMRSLLASSVH